MLEEKLGNGNMKRELYCSMHDEVRHMKDKVKPIKN